MMGEDRFSEFDIRKADNGGFAALARNRYDMGSMPRLLLSASNAPDFLAMLCSALDVTPEQVARARDRLTPPGIEEAAS